MRMGLINLDLMDLRAIVDQTGEARCWLALVDRTTRKAFSRPPESAPRRHGRWWSKGCLIQVEGGLGMTIGQVEAVADLFTRALDNDADVILGARVSEDLVDTIRVGPFFRAFTLPNPAVQFHRRPKQPRSPTRRALSTQRSRR